MLQARAVVSALAAVVAIAMVTSCATDMPSDAQILHAVQAKSPGYFDSNGNSKIHIIKVVNPQPGWFVASVRVDGAGETGKGILRQEDPPNSPLEVIADPGTAFPAEYVSLPDAVRKAL